MADAGDLQVHALWADAGSKDKIASESCERANEGLVFTLGASCKIMRGTESHQTSLFPPMWNTMQAEEVGKAISTLRLEGPESVSCSGRMLTFDFGALIFTLAPLTHTSIQFYPKEVWQQSVIPVNKKLRKYHVGLAFEFEKFVMAFLSYDLLFQPGWYCSMEDLPQRLPDVYDDFPGFLETIAAHLKLSFNKPNTGKGRFITAMHSNQSIWSKLGVGVYTANEIMIAAGLPQDLTELEVLRVPSWMARVIAAFYTFAANTKHDDALWSLLRPSLHGGIMMAPTQAQRARYARWLLAYGKSELKCTARHAALIDEYNVCTSRCNIDPV
ncbi:hypothetical protein NEOLEDRAFT_1078383 [Neolentinus lepideus HHB14362 ss-1]|uniref:Uncharacterized protein n=1 Tax=Neolentinus lepideus HHB14362 ss-1 TaxID=1314782 RepID=A0A165N5W3_9AGAM|nr:hypothetical protein NEOLEDRAFT_1078383 [Neolentinus lepideus HHB14362 ss-1]